MARKEPPRMLPTRPVCLALRAFIANIAPLPLSLMDLSNQVNN